MDRPVTHFSPIQQYPHNKVNDTTEETSPIASEYKLLKRKMKEITEVKKKYTCIT